ncbi:DUF4920 domain-containing protein [Lutibacter sp.]|uniref:DUF4920 domain-containing protein n=1 Tax=Lutibacter sp. TaxID=1925666 RepID=UPI002733D039|nr:DUF4920 domain-containing protein [Lutibacter sp.]MDP3313486.1 DUF4920 domain-containing protein [Lutibacter sp.]
MKKLVLFLFLSVLLTSTTYSQEGVKYGKKLTLKEKTSISELYKNPKKYVGKTVQVEGLIIKVCEKRGCWIDIASDKEFEKIRLKVEDGVIVFPLEEKGKKIIAEGVFEELIYTKEDLIEQGEHQAKEYGTKFDPKTITKGKTEYRLKGLGAIVK